MAHLSAGEGTPTDQAWTQACMVFFRNGRSGAKARGAAVPTSRPHHDRPPVPALPLRTREVKNAAVATADYYSALILPESASDGRRGPHVVGRFVADCAITQRAFRMFPLLKVTFSQFDPTWSSRNA